MTCYDCIHYDACSDAGDAGFSCLKEDVTKCKHFKNKADFAEVVRCEKCKHFMEYNEDYVGKVEKADVVEVTKVVEMLCKIKTNIIKNVSTMIENDFSEIVKDALGERRDE